MEWLSFISQTLSLFTLLIICSFTYVISKKVNFPYTVLLVIVWLLLVPISQIWMFSFIDDFKLTPNVLFFVFLPFLLFEWWYNINYKQLLYNWKSIWILSVFSLLISWFFISVVLYFSLNFAWFHIPYLICLLFWSLISATDPVAVLSIFKRLWAPRRLTILFEWESLFNDGTAVAFFLVILAVILDWWSVTSMTVFWWIWKFFTMLFWWIIFWILMWALFSHIIWKINNNEEAEILLTMMTAHTTFIASELVSRYIPYIPISWVIATVIASIVIWNYWKYKITPKVEIHMQKFWEFFAFVANSIVFILMWLILSTIDIHFKEFLLPMFISIIVVMLARFVSVYFPIYLLNKLKIEDFIPYNWAKLLSWWSLRWALALMMVLLIPDVWSPDYENLLHFEQLVWWNYKYSIKDFLTVITIWCIMFTLFVKAPITPKLMNELKLDKLNKLEEFEFDEWKILAYFKVLEKINSSFRKAYITIIEYEDLKSKYTSKLNEAINNMKSLIWDKQENTNTLIKKAITLHALWIEKQQLKDLYLYNEIEELNFKYILRRIEKQIERVERENIPLEKIYDDKSNYDIFSKFVISVYETTSTDLDAYIRNRTLLIITRKVIKELRELAEIDFWFDKKLFDEVIELFALFSKKADEKRIKLFSEHKATINAIEARLVEKSLLKLEEGVVTELYEREIITPKLFLKFIDNIEDERYSDIKKLT